MKHFLVNSACLLALTLSTQAEPKQQRQKGREPGARNREFATQFFARLDSNQDGAVDEEEFGANPRLKKATPEQRATLFKRLDKDGDGLIKRAEFKPPKQMGRERGKRPRWLENGPVDYETFSKQPRVQKLQEDMRRRLFERMDRNGDGMLSKEDSPRQRGEQPERPNRRPDGPPPHFKFDSDNDGKVSFTEFQKAPHIDSLGEDKAEDRFESLDKNSDGVLDEDEQKAIHPPRERKNKRKDKK